MDVVYIAGDLSADDWRVRASELRNRPSPELWQETFEGFFRQRLDLRYLDPIELLQAEGTMQGEGFAIVSIQCALIEFLAAAREGLVYTRKPQTEFEYSKSGELFERFLSEVEPFKMWFTSELAHEFYANVRCGLLHEASTKGGWRIWAPGANPITARTRTVHRNALQDAILAYIGAYGVDLMTSTQLQEAFLRKFDSLAESASMTPTT